MTMDKTGLGGIEISCDEGGCAMTSDSDCETYKEAYEEFYEEGWRAYKDDDDEWCHSCPGHVEEYRERNK